MTSKTVRQISERAFESLYEDERLRSNLTDIQATRILNWASDWLKRQVSAASDDQAAREIAQAKGQKVRELVSVLNSLAAKGTFTREQGMGAIEPILASDKSLPRQELARLLGQVTKSAPNRSK